MFNKLMFSHFKFGAKRTLPFVSTIPGTPIPIPITPYLLFGVFLIKILINSLTLEISSIRGRFYTLFIDILFSYTTVPTRSVTTHKIQLTPISTPIE